MTLLCCRPKSVLYRPLKVIIGHICDKIGDQISEYLDLGVSKMQNAEITQSKKLKLIAEDSCRNGVLNSENTGMQNYKSQYNLLIRSIA